MTDCASTGCASRIKPRHGEWRQAFKLVEGYAMRSRFLTWMLALMPVMLFSHPCFGQAGDIPVPKDLAVSAPGTEVPRELAAYSGRWSGSFNGVMTGSYMSDGLIVVEKIQSTNSVQIYYAGVGRFRTNRGDKWSIRGDARFVDGALEFRNDRFIVNCKLVSEDGMQCVKSFPKIDRANHGSFRRIAEK